MAYDGNDLTATAWRKSSFSNGTGGDCVEVAETPKGLIPVRDSKQTRPGGSGPVLLFAPHAWAAFIHTYRVG